MTTPYYPPPPPNGYGYGYGAPAVAPTAPGPVKGAFFIYLVAALLAVVGIVLVVTSNVWDQAIADHANEVNTSGMSAQSLVNAVKIVAVVAGLIFVVLYLLFAFKMRAGRNWARIVLTVLSALSIASSARGSGSVTVDNQVYSVGSSQASGWIGTALAVVAIVLMYLPTSNAYFRDSKAFRHQPLR